MKKKIEKKENISFIDSSERRRKSFFGFTEKYPDRLKSVKYDKKEPRRRRRYIIITVFIMLLFFVLGFFVMETVLDLSYMPV